MALLSYQGAEARLVANEVRHDPADYFHMELPIASNLGKREVRLSTNGDTGTADEEIAINSRSDHPAPVVVRIDPIYRCDTHSSCKTDLFLKTEIDQGLYARYGKAI